MKEAAILLVAVVLLILGIKGTYAALWDKLFPAYPITVAPPVQVGNPNAGIVIGWPGSTTSSSGGSSSPSSSRSSSSQVATNPNEVGQQLGNATKKAVASAVNSLTNTANQAHTVPAKASVNPVESIGTTQQEVLSTGVPDWWPSWLPYPSFFPHPGEGQTGKIINNPYAP